MHLFFDTETTGLYDEAEIAQFAAILCDENRKIVGEFKAMVKPDGWTMPEETAAFHGITQERLEKYGIAVQGVFSLFNKWCEKADTLIAHNISYDVARMRYTAARLNLTLRMPENVFCTLKSATDIIKLPATPKMIEKGMGDKYKPPNLKEAYAHFTGGQTFDGAHDAMADVKAAMTVFYALQDGAAA